MRGGWGGVAGSQPMSTANKLTSYLTYAKEGLIGCSESYERADLAAI
jgi:hypothetical protein